MFFQTSLTSLCFPSLTKTKRSNQITNFSGRLNDFKTTVELFFPVQCLISVGSSSQNKVSFDQVCLSAEKIRSQFRREKPDLFLKVRQTFFQLTNPLIKYCEAILKLLSKYPLKVVLLQMNSSSQRSTKIIIIKILSHSVNVAL